MPSTERENGFTLVELMVVVLVIGILVAVAIPIYQRAWTEIRTRSCFANQRTVEGAYTTYVASQSVTPAPFADTTALMAALVPNYIREAPACPAGGAYTWQQSGDLNCSAPGHFHY
jgi:prepilin-type N-terminal cleavage/methylation domain-containing protein